MNAKDSSGSLPVVKADFDCFSPQDVSGLKFIQRAQALGFSLQEVRNLLILRDESTEACPHVRDLLEHKVEIVRHRMKEMRKLESELKGALRRCNREMKKVPGSHRKRCPVLEEIGPSNQDGRNK
jgi:hypothetical protein